MTTTETLTLPVWQGAKEEEANEKEFAATEQLADASSSSDLVLAQSAANGNMAAFEEI